MSEQVTAVADRIGFNTIGDVNSDAANERVAHFADGWFELLGEVAKENFSNLEHRRIGVKQDSATYSFQLLTPAELKNSKFRALNLQQILTITKRVIEHELPRNSEWVRDQMESDDDLWDDVRIESSGLADAAAGLLNMTRATANRHRQGITGFMRAMCSSVGNDESSRLDAKRFEGRVICAITDHIFTLDSKENVAFGKKLIKHLISYQDDIVNTYMDVTIGDVNRELKTDISQLDETEYKRAIRRWLLANRADAANDADRTAHFQALYPKIKAAKEVQTALSALRNRCKNDLSGVSAHTAAQVAPVVAILTVFTLLCAVYPGLLTSARAPKRLMVALSVAAPVGCTYYLWRETGKTTGKGKLKYSAAFRIFSRYVLPTLFLATNVWALRRLHNRFGLRYLIFQDLSVLVRSY